MLKANMKMDGKPCGWCQVPLHLGDDAAQCTTCDKEHHSRCWEQSGGCATAGCVNAPLRRLDGGAPGTQAGYGSPYPPPGAPSPYAPPGAPSPYAPPGTPPP
ncbi:MAG TPA: RING finger protein, partial [Kofleriaceae bacterium]|nr:RING finger protein [Kofleriaceae bacterium]